MTEGRRIAHMREIFGRKEGEREGEGVEEEQEGVRGAESGGQPHPGTTPNKKAHQEAKHLERHLSMKKTIRKKIMRELQQAFVEHPEEFTGQHLQQDKNNVSITFGKGGNFLDFLRTGEAETPTNEPAANQSQDKHGFWRRFAFRRNKR